MYVCISIICIYVYCVCTGNVFDVYTYIHIPTAKLVKLLLVVKQKLSEIFQNRETKQKEREIANRQHKQILNLKQKTEY